jgi:hypothetical protein
MMRMLLNINYIRYFENYKQIERNNKYLNNYVSI